MADQSMLASYQPSQEARLAQAAQLANWTNAQMSQQSRALYAQGMQAASMYNLGVICGAMPMGVGVGVQRENVSLYLALKDPKEPSKLRRWWWLKQMAFGEWLIAWSKK